MKTLVILGHGQGPVLFDPGAEGNGTTEAAFLRNLFYPAMKAVSGSEVDYITDKNVYAFGLANSISGYDEIIELHLDSAKATTAEDGHVIIYKTFSPDAIDIKIRDVVKKHVGIRGVDGFSYRDDLANLRIFANRGISYRLVELAFISNKKEMDYMKANYKAYAADLVEAITGQKNSNASKQREIDFDYKIKQGDTLYGIARKYNVSVADLKGWNNLSSNLIRIGDFLKIRGAADLNVIEEPKLPEYEKAKAEYIFLPATATSWRVYPIGVKPIAGNEKGFLSPAKYFGLEYPVMFWVGPKVAVIQTEHFGKVQIYVGEETGAEIYWK